ncbi:MAG: 2-oxo acid dehydrogenase subunit E2 [Lentisphaeria bacterium]|nr:2-oxo acid dehydrogenase subunit E2 [Lentisphaeria bacterium]
MATAIVMPKQGNTVEECLLTEWRVKVGDTVSAGDIVAGIETDKATFEVESPVGGTVLALFREEGELVPVLEAICAVGEPGEDLSGLAAESKGSGPAPEASLGEVAAAPTALSASVAVAAAAVEDAAPGGAVPMSPRARSFVREHPAVLPPLAGSGPGGRVLERDVVRAYEGAPRLSAAASRLVAEGASAPAGGTGVGGMILTSDVRQAGAAAAAVPAAAAGSEAASEGEVKEVRLSNIRRIIAGRLHESVSTMAQYTLHAEVDATDLLALRRRLKAAAEALGLGDVTVGDLVMYATVRALCRHPEINAEFDGTVLRQHRAVHLGFACDTPRGLMVPVVHHAEALSPARLGARVRELAREASSGALNPDLMRGGTFTVSNLGALGITGFTPVINAPQVGILGVGGTILRPLRQGEAVVYRDMMQLSLTLDHRVVDGAPGARFLQTLRSLLENVDLVSLAG